jgi:NitT/TauT family transport system ATP-binding protein/sulfonate transport system ATP-binding protein
MPSPSPGYFDPMADPVEASATEALSLHVKNVSKAFKSTDGSSVLALEDVSLSVRPGELVSLIGESGCGKSTLLRLIAGLDHPTAGELRVGSEVVKQPSAERGMMFQSANLFPWLTVRRNVRLRACKCRTKSWPFG